MLDRVSERIEYIDLDGEKEKSFFDLSATGISCLFHRRLAPDVFVSVKIDELILKGRVVYCQERKDGFRLGIQFVDVFADQQKKLNETVEKFSRGVAIRCAIIDAPDSPSH